MSGCARMTRWRSSAWSSSPTHICMKKVGPVLELGAAGSIAVWSAHLRYCITWLLSLCRCSRVYVECSAVTASWCTSQPGLCQAVSRRPHKHAAQGWLCCAFLQLHLKGSRHGWVECAFRMQGLHCAPVDAACSSAPYAHLQRVSLSD